MRYSAKKRSHLALPIPGLLVAGLLIGAFFGGFVSEALPL